MYTEEVFLHAVCADPDDDAARLIYADWLQEPNRRGNITQADEDRAKFIRAQCNLADPRLASDSRRPEWEADESNLLPGQQADWLKRLREYGVTEVSFSRGLPEQVTIPAAGAFIANGGELLKRAPIRGVRILRCPDAAALAASANLARLTRLDLGDNGLGPAGARALAASPYLGHLTHLDLTGNGLGAAGAWMLGTSRHLARHLTHLNLENNDIGDVGAAGLHILTRLNYLNLRGNGIGPDAAQALAAAADPAHLELGGNDIGEAVLQEIERCLRARRDLQQGGGGHGSGRRR